MIPTSGFYFNENVTICIFIEIKLYDYNRNPKCYFKLNSISTTKRRTRKRPKRVWWSLRCEIDCMHPSIPLSFSLYVLLCIRKRVFSMCMRVCLYVCVHVWGCVCPCVRLCVCVCIFYHLILCLAEQSKKWQFLAGVSFIFSFLFLTSWQVIRKELQSYRDKKKSELMVAKQKKAFSPSEIVASKSK